MLSCVVGKNIIDTFSYNDEKLRKWSNKKMLKCPCCGENLIYCHGDYKIAYFKHEKNSNCHDKYSEGITEEHISGIKILYDWLKQNKHIKELQVEKWIEETRQRPDIYFKYKGQEYVIEFQCSPISTKFNERRELYKLNNIKDIWILGTNKYFDFTFKDLQIANYLNNTLEKRLKSIEIEILNSELNLIYLNTDNKELFITNNNILEKTKRTKTSYKTNEDYEIELKSTYNFKTNIKNINKFDFNNIYCKEIKSEFNVKEYIYNNVILKDIDFIKEYFNSNSNIDIINYFNDDYNFNLSYKFIDGNIYSIKYNFKNLFLTGFVYNKNDVYINYKIDKNIVYKNNFNLMSDKYHLIGNEFISNSSIYDEFKKILLSSKNNKEENIANELIKYINIFKQYIINKYKIGLDINIHKCCCSNAELYTSIKYKHICRTFYFYKNNRIIDYFRSIEEYIKNNILKEIDNILLLGDIIEHYENYLNNIYVTQIEEENCICYKYNITFENYDSMNIKIYDKYINMNNKNIIFKNENKRKVIMDVISREIRKRKYGGYFE